MRLATIRDALREINAGSENPISETTLRRAVSMGKVPSMPLGNRMMVDVDAARALTEVARKGIDIAELSKKTGLRDCSIRRGIREGWLPAKFTGYKYLFDLKEVERALKQRIKEHAESLK